MSLWRIKGLRLGAHGSSTNDALFILYGQSNVGAQGTSGATPPAAHTALASDGNVKIFNSNLSLVPAAWQALTVGTNSNPIQASSPQYYGAEFEAIERYRAKFPAAKVAVIKYAPGGAQLYDDAGSTPTLLPGATVNGTKHWDLFKAIYNAAVAAGVPLSAGYKTYFFYRQGETDSQDTTKAAAYQANLGTLFAAVRAQLGSYRIVLHQLFGSEHTSLAAAYPYADTVRAGQAAAASGQGDVILIDDKSAWDGQGSNIHYDQTKIDGASGTGARMYSVFAAPVVVTPGSLSTNTPTEGVSVTYTPIVYDYTPITVTYQWQGDVGGSYADIVGATSASYTPATGDVGGHLRVVETVAGAGPSISTISAATTSTVASAGSYQTESNALFGAMTTQPDSTRKTNIDNLIAGLKTDGLWTKLLRLEVFAAHAEQAATLEWKSATVKASVVNAPTYVVDRGWTLVPASTQYIATGLTHSAFGSLNSCGFGLWIRSGTATTDACGVATGGQRVSLNKASSGGITGGLGTSGLSLVGSGSSPPARAVHHYLRRDSSANIDYYFSGASKAANVASTSSSLQAADLWLGRNGSTYVDDGYFCCYFDDGTLNDTDIANLHTRLSTYKTALGA